MNATGNALINSSYAGGNGQDVGTGIALDNLGNIYGIGYTTSSNLVTINAIQPFNAGGYDGYLLKLSPNANSILFATYAGGSGDDFGNSITVDSSGSVYAIGDTNSTNLPTVNPLQSFNAGGFDAFLAKLTPTGSNIVFSTYAGGNGDDSGRSIAVDDVGNIYAVSQFVRQGHRLSVYGAPQASKRDLINLAMFGPFEPGLGPRLAVKRFGEPQRIIPPKSGAEYVEYTTSLGRFRLGSEESADENVGHPYFFPNDRRPESLFPNCPAPYASYAGRGGPAL